MNRWTRCEFSYNRPGIRLRCLKNEKNKRKLIFFFYKDWDISNYLRIFISPNFYVRIIFDDLWPDPGRGVRQLEPRRVRNVKIITAGVTSEATENPFLSRGPFIRWDTETSNRCRCSSSGKTCRQFIHVQTRDNENPLYAIHLRRNVAYLLRTIYLNAPWVRNRNSVLLRTLHSFQIIFSHCMRISKPNLKMYR